MTEARGEVDLATVLAEIRAAVAENTASGVYSETLEDELHSHFARLIDRSRLPDRSRAAWAAVDEVNTIRSLAAMEVGTDSRVPGGRLVHRTAQRLVQRQLTSSADHSNTVHEAIVVALQSVLTLVDSLVTDPHLELLHELDTLQDRVAALEARIGLQQTSLDVTRRIEDLERSAHRSDFQPNYSSLEFDERTRGNVDEIRAEYTSLADVLVGVPGPVLDIGAGRGELLELLVERGVKASGVELDEELVAVGLARGLDVQLENGLDALRGRPNGSLGAITMIHVIEHLRPSELQEIIAMSFDRLAPDGKLVLETPNPQSLYIYARAFYLDPTHDRPIHPIYLEFVLRSAGFTHLEFDWTALPADDERMLEIPGDDETTRIQNENVRRLNQLVYAAQNYRVIATR